MRAGVRRCYTTCFIPYQGTPACCTFAFAALLLRMISRHDVEVDWYRFENVLGNHRRRIDCMKSIHSNLTNHRVLHCDKSKQKLAARSWDEAVVRVLASHQCGEVRFFSRSLVSLPPQKPTRIKGPHENQLRLMWPL